MQFIDFLRRVDDQLPNSLLAEHLVVPGQAGIGPVRIGQPFEEVRSSLGWRSDSPEWQPGNGDAVIRFWPNVANPFRLQTMAVQRDAAGQVGYAEWQLLFSQPPRDANLEHPWPVLEPALTVSLGKPKKKVKTSARLWSSGDTSVVLASGVEGTDWESMVVLAVVRDAFAANASLHPLAFKLLG